MSEKLSLEAIGILIGFAVGLIAGGNTVVGMWRDAAVRHKAAEYYLDGNYSRKCKWIDTRTDMPRGHFPDTTK